MVFDNSELISTWTSGFLGGLLLMMWTFTTYRIFNSRRQTPQVKLDQTENMEAPQYLEVIRSMTERITNLESTVSLGNTTISLLAGQVRELYTELRNFRQDFQDVHFVTFSSPDQHPANFVNMMDPHEVHPQTSSRQVPPAPRTRVHAPSSVSQIVQEGLRSLQSTEEGRAALAEMVRSIQSDTLNEACVDDDDVATTTAETRPSVQSDVDSLDPEKCANFVRHVMVTVDQAKAQYDQIAAQFGNVSGLTQSGLEARIRTLRQIRTRLANELESGRTFYGMPEDFEAVHLDDSPDQFAIQSALFLCQYEQKQHEACVATQKIREATETRNDEEDEDEDDAEKKATAVATYTAQKADASMKAAALAERYLQLKESVDDSSLPKSLDFNGLREFLVEE